MKIYKKIILALTICALGFVAIQWLRKRPEVSVAKVKEATPVEVITARSGSILRRVTAVGTLSAIHSVKLHPQASGKVVKIYVEEGQVVKAGAPIFKLDDALAKAKLREAEALFALKREDHKRAVKLLEKKFGSVQARDKALAEMQQAEANVEEMKVRLDYTTIVAPFEGVLGLHDVSQGSYVSEQNPIATLVDLDPINVSFALPESYLPFVHEGDSVDVTIEDFDILPVDAKIIAISPEIDEATRTVQLRAQFSNKEKAYRPGEFARVVVVAGSVKDAVLIPNICVEREGETEYVWVIADNVAVRTTVSTDLRDGTDVEITHGLKPGALVVSAGQFKVLDGNAVTIVNTPQKKAEEK